MSWSREPEPEFGADAGAGRSSGSLRATSRKRPLGGDFGRSSRSIPTCLPVGRNGRRARRPRPPGRNRRAKSEDDTASRLPLRRTPLDEWPGAGPADGEPEIEPSGGREPRTEAGAGAGRQPPPGRSRPGAARSIGKDR